METFLIRDDVEIIKQVNELAEKLGTSRAELYRRGIRLILALYTEQEQTDHDHE